MGGGGGGGGEGGMVVRGAFSETQNVSGGENSARRKKTPEKIDMGGRSGGGKGDFPFYPFSSPRNRLSF